MKKYLILVLIGAVLLIPFVFRPTKGVFSYAAKPFLIISNKIAKSFVSSPLNFFETIHSINNLLSENSQLQGRVRNLESERANLLESQKENEILKKQLGYILTNQDAKLIPAYIIGRNPSNTMQYLIIDKGGKDNIAVGQVVINEGVLIGKVTEVNYTTAKVFLITNPNSAVPALTQDSRASGLVRGEIGYGLILEDIVKEVVLKEDENVITSGLGEEYPRGLFIGKIDKTVSSAADLFQKASIKTISDIKKLEMVFVLETK